MMTSENSANCQRRIQRCIDDELSLRETRELLFQLDSVSDGWKTLACGLLEDRNFHRAMTTTSGLQQAAIRSSRPDSSVAAGGVESFRGPLREIARRTWSHPLVSLTLCAAIAFVSGLLIPDWTRSGVSARIAAQARPVISPADSSRDQSYFLELQPGQRPVEVPVVSEVRDLRNLDPDHPLRNPSTGEKWIVAPVGRNSYMLIPASKDPSFEMQ